MLCFECANAALRTHSAAGVLSTLCHKVFTLRLALCRPPRPRINMAAVLANLPVALASVPKTLLLSITWLFHSFLALFRQGLRDMDTAKVEIGRFHITVPHMTAPNLREVLTLMLASVLAVVSICGLVSHAETLRAALIKALLP